MSAASVSWETRSCTSGQAACVIAAWAAVGGSAASPDRCRNGSTRPAKSSGDSARILSPLMAFSLRTSNWAAFLLTRARSNSAAISASVNSSRFSPGDQPSRAR